MIESRRDRVRTNITPALLVGGALLNAEADWVAGSEFDVKELNDTGC